ncbi:MAG: hypothetical protein ABIZ57_01525 [Candidatus Limnocylindria bacterium]
MVVERDLELDVLDGDRARRRRSSDAARAGSALSTIVEVARPAVVPDRRSLPYTSGIDRARSSSGLLLMLSSPRTFVGWPPRLSSDMRKSNGPAARSDTWSSCNWG